MPDQLVAWLHGTPVAALTPAGAVMLLPDGEQAGPEDRSGYAPMTPAGLRQVIGDLDAAPLGVAPERGFRPSLPGFQRKALLGRAPDGTWQLPYDRLESPGGALPARLHQEDGCQATATPPSDEVRGTGRPGTARPRIRCRYS